MTEPEVDEDPQWRPPPRWTWLILLGVLVLVIAGVGLAGGLNRAPDPQAGVPTVAPSQDVDGGPWTVAVTNATAATDLGFYKPSTGNYLLAIVVRMHVRGPDPEDSSELDRATALPGFVGLVERTPRWVILVRDASELQVLNPGLTERVAFIYEVKAGTPRPAKVTVQVLGFVPHFAWTTQRLEWTDFGPHAQVTVPVKDAG